ncbi:hypothetical protein HN873_034926 [Arachis hypogaea]
MTKASLVLPCLLFLFLVASETGMAKKCAGDGDCKHLFCHSVPPFPPRPCVAGCLGGHCGCICLPPKPGV